MERFNLGLDRVSAYYLLDALPEMYNDTELSDILRSDKILTFGDLSRFLDGNTASFDKFRAAGRYSNYHDKLLRELDAASVFCEEFNSGERVPPMIWDFPIVNGIDPGVIDNVNWSHPCIDLDVVYPSVKVGKLKEGTYPEMLTIAEAKSLLSCVEMNTGVNSLMAFCNLKSKIPSAYARSIIRHEQFLMDLMEDIDIKSNYRLGMDVFDYEIEKRRAIIMRHLPEFVDLLLELEKDGKSFSFGNLTPTRKKTLYSYREPDFRGDNSMFVNYLAHRFTPSELTDFDSSLKSLKDSATRGILVRRLTR